MVRTPNIPPVIESRESEYRDSGITSTVAIAGHPLHPLLVTFPITFLVSVAASDIGYWLTRDPFWARVSIWMLGAGIVSGLVAAATGMMDYFRIERVRKRVAGPAHMFLNIAALLASLFSFIVRWGNAAGAILPIGITLSIIVALLLGVSGWYGGELVYRHKIAVIGYGSRREPREVDGNGPH